MSTAVARRFHLRGTCAAALEARHARSGALPAQLRGPRPRSDPERPTPRSRGCQACRGAG